MAASYALALPESRARRPALYGTRAQLALGDGDVEGYLALADCDRRAGTASYALRIVNQSAHPLRARMSCARLRSEPILAYPLDIHIAPFSISETLLPVRLTDVGPYDRAIVQVAGGDVAFSLEAPAPPKRRRRARWLAVGTAAATLTLGCAFAAASATPRIGTIAAPERALAGTTIDVPYAFGGWASMRYALETADGRQISAGLAREHEGTLHFSVPAAAGQHLILSARVAGPFGTQAQNSSIAIAGAAAPRTKTDRAVPPHISQFALVTPVVHTGGSLTLSYATNARGGEVQLVDETGRVRAAKAAGAAGIVVLNVPHGTAGQYMRAVLQARDGKAAAVASVGFKVLPWPGQAGTQAQAASAAAAPPELTLSTDSAAPGDTVTVQIQGKHGDTQISLNDASGNAIEQGDIPATQNAVTLTAPAVTAPSTFYVMASVTQGVGEQTLVKKLSVAPR